MNILFVNYGDFTSNSLNHIGGFANTLCVMGHACVVAVPGGKDTLTAIPHPLFIAATYDEVLVQPGLFPNGKSADIIHAWTPREGVRKFILAHQRIAPARVVVHLEDNEEFLISAYMGQPLDTLRGSLDEEMPKLLTDGLPHPVRYKNLLRLADGATVILERLKTFTPADLPVAVLPPGVDFKLYQSRPAHSGLRQELGLRDDEKVLVFTGSNTFANEPEMRELYLAVSLLNQRGTPTRLVRTGFNSPKFQEQLPPGWRDWTLDLGFVEKAKLPGLLALADVLVQPGRPGDFNDYRLPSKLPEFLASGRPVVLPATNLAAQLRDGVDALILPEATPEAMADACERLFADPKLAATIGKHGAAFARRHFDLAANTARLVEFYATIAAAPANPAWTGARSPAADVSLLAAQLARRLSALSPHHASHAELASFATDLSLLCRQLEIAATSDLSPLHALRKKLEQECAEWKRSWELTRQHATNIEQAFALTRTHAENLERTLGVLRTEHDKSEVFRHQAETLLRTARHQNTVFEAELGRSEANRHHLESELTHTRKRAGDLGSLLESSQQRGAQLEQQLIQREAKVHQMTDSFSWRATAWLRSLRRVFVDPYVKRRPAAAQVSVVPPPVPAEFGQIAPPSAPDRPSFYYAVDYPHTWHFGPKKVLVRGWCFAKEATAAPLKEIRARVNGRLYPGVYGLKRLDVLAALRNHTQAEYCGFKVEVQLEVGDTNFALDVGDSQGGFHPFFTHEISVREGGGIEELTNYEKWVEAFDRPTPEQLNALGANARHFPFQPLISILVPVYNTPEKWLAKAVDSVRAQVYPHWELCLADDASPSPHVRPLLERYAREDRRIKVVSREQNGHISAASNSALELASGEFTALLDHDDELAPHALYEVVKLLNAHPDTNLIYSDEDKIDEDGRRHEPYFKPDWLPDLFLGQNYVSHLTVYRTSVMRDAGGFRVGYEGSQDWDLALRVVERIDPGHIRHIPRVLYHWRAIPGSTALMLSEKNYPLEAARRALTDHFSRLGQPVELATVPGDHWRVKYPLPSPAPLVSLIIPTRNGLKFLQRCVDSILEKTTYPNFEILVVDNGTDDPATLAYLATLREGTHPLLRPHHTTRVLSYDAPFNFSALNNFAVRQAAGELVGLLNNDLEVISPDWLDEMAAHALRPGIGCVGAVLYYPNNTIQHAGVIIGLGGVAGHAFRDLPRGTEGKFNRARLVQDYTAVTAACLVIRKSLYEQVGGLDAETLTVGFNDIDFCLKVRAAGYRNLWTPFAELYHHESASRGAEDTPEKHERFRLEVETMLQRWPDVIRHDPAYNPNLTLEFTDFSLAAPPRLWSP